MSSIFKENLRKELDYQGVTVKELGARTGIPVATLDCYLGARTTIPSVEAAVKIAQALQVSVEYLAIGDNLDPEKTQKKHSREAKELVQIIENLNNTQCKAILNLMNVFKNSNIYLKGTQTDY